MRPTVFVNLTSRLAATEISSTANVREFAPVVAGDMVGWTLRFFEVLSPTLTVERFIGLRSLRASIGYIDKQPLSGNFSLKVGTGVSTTYNTTALLSYSATASEVQTALNGLPAVQALGNCVVTKESDSWIVECVGLDAELGLSAGINRLAPISFVKVSAQKINSRWVNEVRLVQAPLASSADYDHVLPDPPKCSIVKTGWVDYSDVLPTKYPTIQKLFVGQSFKGMFLLRSGTKKTRYIDPTVDGLDVIKAEVEKMLSDTVTVVASDNNTALMTFSGPRLNGTEVSVFSVEVVEAPPPYLTFDLDLATYEMAYALRGVSQLTVPFEVEADIVDTVDQITDSSVPSQRVTLFSTTIVVKQELNWKGLERVPQIDWLRPPQAVDYIPFTRDQVITGSQSYSAPIGDGHETNFEITHGLGTEALFVSLRENKTHGAYLDQSAYTLTSLGVDVLRLSFATAPAANGFVLAVLAAGPKSAFEAHHHTVLQIEGLQTVLDDYDRRISALTPAQLVATAQQNFSPLSDPTFQIPNMAELLPDGHGLSTVSVASQMVYSTGATPQIQGGSQEAVKTAAITATIVAATPKVPDKPVPVVQFSIPALSIALPCSAPIPPKATDGTTPPVPVAKMPPLLAALRSVNPTATGVLLANAGLGAGNVYRATTALVLPGGAGRHSRKLAVGDYFASDGRYWYQVMRSGTDYYASEFEQTLFSVPVDAVMLLNSKQLELVCNVALSLQNANAQAQQTLILELGQTMAGSGPASGLASIAWSAPILSQVLTITGLETGHGFGVRLRADGLETAMYGNWVKSDTAPPVGNLILRARLTKFDCEDVTDPRGVLRVAVPATVAAIY
jgi:hypothetical protein